MSVSLAQLLGATAQSQSQLVLQLVKVVKFPLYVGQLFLQPALYRRTSLQAIPSQPQKPSDLTELESQALHAADERQRLDIAFAVPPKASLCPGRSRKQTVTLVKANRVNAEADLLCDDPNLHRLRSSPRSYTLEYSPESSPYSSYGFSGYDLYLGTGNRHLYGLNVDSGEVLGEYATESAPNRQLLIAENPLVVFLGDEVYASFDLDLKKIRWCAQASKEWTSARPYLWHGAALAGDRRELVRLERRPRMGASFSGNSPRHWNVRRDSVRGDPEGTRFRLPAQALSARQETETLSATSFDSAQTV